MTSGRRANTTLRPVLGDLLVAALLLTGLGAVVLSYYGLTTFEPASIPE